MLKYLGSFNYQMVYSETRMAIGGLAHVPVLILIANFIEANFRIKSENVIVNVVKEEAVKIIEIKKRFYS